MMKRNLAMLFGCMILSFCMTACSDGSLFSDNFLKDFTAGSTNSFYNEYMGGNIDGSFRITGKAHLNNTLTILYITPNDDTTLNMHGELKAISGDVQIVYVNPDNEDTVISDGSDSINRDLYINTSIALKKGDGRIEFRGDKSTFKLELNFDDIDNGKYEYVGSDKKNDSEKQQGTQADKESKTTKDTADETSEEISKKVTVSYSDSDTDCNVLNTKVSQNTNVKVRVRAHVNDVDEKGSSYFGGFKLIYKTEYDKVIDVIDCTEKSLSIGGYEWLDSFENEVTLPAGTNELIYQNYKGNNYTIELDVQVTEVK